MEEKDKYKGLEKVLTETLNTLAEEDGFFEEPEDSDYISNVGELQGLSLDAQSRIIADALFKGEKIRKLFK